MRPAPAVDFIRRTLWRDGRLLATYKDGRAHLPAYLDDYAFLADALLELLQTRWRSSDLEFARQLADVLLAQFEDPEAGGFFFTADGSRAAHSSQQDLQRRFACRRATASPPRCCAGLGTCSARLRYLDAAERTLRAAWPAFRDIPGAHEPGERAGGFPGARCKS